MAKFKSPSWQRKEGKSPSGGLNAKGRASLKAAMAQAERNRIYREAQEAKAKLNPRFVK